MNKLPRHEQVATSWTSCHVMNKLPRHEQIKKRVVFEKAATLVNARRDLRNDIS